MKKKIKIETIGTIELKPTIDKFSRSQEDYIRALELSVQSLQFEVERLRNNPKEKIVKEEITKDSIVSHSFFSCYTKEDVHKLILKLFAKQFNILESSLFFYNSKKKLMPAIPEGFSAGFNEQISHLEEQGIIDWVLYTNDVEIIPNPEDKRGKPTNFILVPVVIRGEKHSIFIAKTTSSKNSFDKSKLNNLMKSIEDAAVAIDNLQSLDEISEMNKRLSALNRQMLESSRLASIGELAGSIARDIESPLSIIMGNINLIESGVGDRKRRIQIIKEQTEKISEINNRLANIAESTQSDIKPSPINLIELMEEVLLFSSSQLQKEGIIITKDYEALELSVFGMRSQLEQVFLNIFLTSKTTMPEGGKINVNILRSRNETVQINIIDSGIGFSEAQLEGIFEPHYSSKQEFTGKGLYVAKNLIEQHKGSISVYSTEERGTTYKVVFPAYERYL